VPEAPFESEYHFVEWSWGGRLARESSDDGGGLVIVRAFVDDFGADDGIGADAGVFSGFFIGKVYDFEQA
jgi:hypothetical protein